MDYTDSTREFPEGTKVTVTLDAVVDMVNGDGSLELIVESGDGSYTVDYVDPAKVTKRAPQVGDVITEREARNLPNDSVALRVSDGKPFTQKAPSIFARGGLFYGNSVLTDGVAHGDFKVLHIG